MKSSRILRQFVITLFAFAFCGAGIARAQYTPAGTTPGGGNILVGNGTLPALGPGAPLSVGGFDQVTLNIGSATSVSGQDAIVFATSNDTLLNNGMVTGPLGFNAIEAFLSNSSLTGESITNNGTITTTAFGNLSGAQYGNNYSNNEIGSNAGVALAITSGSSVSGISISNTGAILGASIEFRHEQHRGRQQLRQQRHRREYLHRHRDHFRQRDQRHFDLKHGHHYRWQHWRSWRQYRCG